MVFHDLPAWQWLRKNWSPFRSQKLSQPTPGRCTNVPLNHLEYISLRLKLWHKIDFLNERDEREQEVDWEPKQKTTSWLVANASLSCREIGSRFLSFSFSSSEAVSLVHQRPRAGLVISLDKSFPIWTDFTTNDWTSMRQMFHRRLICL